MTLKGGLFTLIAFLLGSLLLFSDSGMGMLLGGSIIAIVAIAIVTALKRQDPALPDKLPR